jgi:hypothetical protein
MPETTPAETTHPAVVLQQAAERLRLAAGSVPEGPWRVEVVESRLSGVHRLHETIKVVSADCGIAIAASRAEARYIAGMQPAFALAVADWLATCARDAEGAYLRADGGWGLGGCDDPPGIEAALKIARACLGEAVDA